jgi:4-methyl-5(b-hydroxyethyl)-thiazole monophosphate biosynthesis
MKIICLLADGFEDIEALGTVAILRRSGIIVDLVSVLNGPVVTGAWGTKTIPDKMMKDVSEKDYDGLFLPGGSAAKTLRENPGVKKIVLAFAAKQKILAAICAGPTVLGMLGLLDGIPYTSFPGTESFMPRGIKVAKASIVSGNIVTGAGAGCVMEFAFDVIGAALGNEKAQEVKKRMLYHLYE